MKQYNQELIDKVYDAFKDMNWFKKMSMDEQGELCVKTASMFKNVAAVATQAAIKDFFRKHWCGNVDYHNESIAKFGTCLECKKLKKDAQNA